MAEPTFADQIKGAIAAHSMWKGELDAAIATGKSSKDVNVVKKEDACAFGQWLHGNVDAQHKKGEDFAKVKDLHAKFHQAAAGVLTLALAGKKEDAKKAMGQGTPFADTSASLTRAMMQWGKKA